MIAKARVPIIKFVEVESNIQFDISFDVENGPAAAKFIRESMTTLPPLRPLCLVVKIFLQQRELNEVSVRCFLNRASRQVVLSAGAGFGDEHLPIMTLSVVHSTGEADELNFS